MWLEELTLEDFRGYKNATLRFQPGMNLLVGINGAGKSTILEAIRLLLSHALPEISASKAHPFLANQEDIANGQLWLYAALRFRIDHFILEEDMRVWIEHAEATIDDEPEPEAQPESPEQETSNREQQQTFYRFRGVLEEALEGDKNQNPEAVKAHLQQEQARLKALPKQWQRATEQALAIYFSPHRSLVKVNEESKPERSARGQAAAFVEALDPERPLKVAQFAQWWVALKALSDEPDKAIANRASAIVQALEDAVTHFLDGLTNVYAITDPKPTLMLDKAGITLDVRQLSDGERSVLAMVLDIARRLAQANPNLTDPLHEGEAVVLIDELDLHLHPQWQRTIVQKLTTTFPRCQFIATTHSPQIVGEVPPENIILLEPDKEPYWPDQSLGMDTNWILQVLMGTPDRNVETAQQLEDISDLIDDEAYEQAKHKIDQLRERMPDDPELAKLQVRLDRLQMLGE